MPNSAHLDPAAAESDTRYVFAIGHDQNPSASQVLARLAEGNARYVAGRPYSGDVTADARRKGAQDGQAPYAIVLTCSDSRVIPEVIFDAGLGELFVIRVAGNVVDRHQLGSIEYAEEHLGCNLIVVLGHTHCGAVEAAIHHDPEGAIKHITDDIREAIGEETDEDVACRLNVAHAIAHIEQSRRIARDEREASLRVVGAVYNLDSGAVEFLE